MRNALLLAVMVLAAAAPAAAQIGSGTIVSYEVEVYDISIDPTGTGTPLLTLMLPAGAALCNLAPLAPPKTLTQVNPQAVYWNDNVNVGKICKLTVPLLGTLPTLGNGSNYIVTVTPVDDRGWLGQRSNVSTPFNTTPPAALTGVGIR